MTDLETVKEILAISTANTLPFSLVNRAAKPLRYKPLNDQIGRVKLFAIHPFMSHPSHDGPYVTGLCAVRIKR